MTIDNSSLKAVASQFKICGNAAEVKALGNGLINDTFLVGTDSGQKYVLQRINNAIFKDVELLQHNIEAVTSHIRAKLEEAGEKDLGRKVYTPVARVDSPSTWLEKDGLFWRMSAFIPGITKSEVTPGSARDAGKAFGQFEAMLSDMEEPLGETIPDFHNMELRSRQLKEAVAADAAGRLSQPESAEILEFIEQYDEEMCKAERMYREGILPKRICHCDPKVNNILFGEDGSIQCVIDLDTVMPSFVFSDFGDFLRTGASTLPEDSEDYAHVEFRMDIYEAFREGYLSTAGCFLTDVEKENLPFAARLFPYMQAVRFFTDYLNGDTYYKISYPEHNLVRTKNQLALFKSATAKLAQNT